MIAPPIFRPPPAFIRAEQGKVTLPNGKVITDDPYGHPMRPDAALAYAMDLAYQWADPVIGCGPGIYSAHIGRGNPNQQGTVVWPNQSVVRDVTVVSLDSARRAQLSLTFDGDVTKSGQGGVDEFSLCGIDLVARWYPNATKPYGDKTPMLVFLGSTHGKIRVQDVLIYAENQSAYNGYGYMWGARSQGWAIHEWRNVKSGKVGQAKAGQEHGLHYFDAPQGDSYFIDLEQLAPSGRTGLQTDERKTQQGYGGVGYTGITRPSIGGILFRRIKLWSDSGGGGSALTIAGHSGGPVIVDDLQVSGDMGAIVVWADTGKGCFLTPDGKICPQFVLNGFRSDAIPDDRALVAIKGCSQVDVYMTTRPDGSPDSLFQTNGTGIDLDNQFGGPILNGKVNLYCPGKASAYAGWKAGTKMKKSGVVLTPAQIDALNHVVTSP